MLAGLASAATLLADAPPATTSIRWTGTDVEGRHNFRLEWDAQPGLLYRVEARTGLEEATWVLQDVLTATNARASCDVSSEQGILPADVVRRGYFRVLQPVAEIFRVEPAVLNTNEGVLHIFGQCLGTNLSLRLGVQVIPANQPVSGPPVAFTIPPGALADGIYDVEILDGTNVLAVLDDGVTVAGQPTPVGEPSTRARLQEVPEEPPGSPVTPSATLLMPALMKAKEKANRTKCSNNLRTMPNGELQMCEVDFTRPGRGLDVIWARTYRSRTGTNSTMGHGWSHSYDVRALSGSNSVTVLDGTGRRDTYRPDTNGLYTVDEIFNVGRWTNGAFVLTFPDRGRWEFAPTNASNAGCLERIIDRNGNTITLLYDGTPRLTAIVDTLGRTNVVAYDFFGRVASVTDFTGLTWTYTYWRQGQAGGGDGDLRSVTTPAVTGTPNTNDFPVGKTTFYSYTKGFVDERQNHNLLTIVDPLGQTWLRVTYKDTFDPASLDFDRVASVQRGTHAPSQFTYVPQWPGASNRWAVCQIIENDPDGNVTIDWFDSMNRGIIHRDLAARAVPGVVLTEGTLPTVPLRPTDPPHWDTTYEWNQDSLCTRMTHPRGNVTEVYYDRAFNQNSSRSNNAKVQDHNSSRSNKSSRAHQGDAILIREGSSRVIGPDMEPDVDWITTRFNYHPDFGCPPNRPFRGHAGHLPGTFSSFPKGPKPPNHMAGRFATSMIDPRGFITSADYDASGNRVALSHHGRLLDGSDSPLSSYEYDAHGQMIAEVQPADVKGDRRRDEFTWVDGQLRSWTVDTTAPDPLVTLYAHDARGNLTEIVDPNGNTNQFLYNQLDQLMKKSSIVHCVGCSAITEEYTYDANDNLVRTEFSNNDHTGASDTNNPSWTTLYQYDVLNRQTHLMHEAAHVVQQRFTTNRFVFDGNDNVIEEHSPEAVNGNQFANFVAHTYDTRGLLHTTTRAPGTAGASTDSFDYDPNGNLVLATYGLGAGSFGSVWPRAYDGFDRVITVGDPLGNVTTFRYDLNGNVIYERLDGQTNDVAGGAGNRRLSLVQHEYDGLDREIVQRISFFDIFTDLALTDGESTTAWTYAPDSSVRSETDDNGHATRFSYDSKGRLVSVTDPKTNVTSYLYDPNGNVTQVKQVDRPDSGGAAQEFTVNYQYDELDRCAMRFDGVGNTEHFAYDSRGNLVRRLDARNVLHGWTYDGLNNVVIIEADLDGDGEWEPLADYAVTQTFDDNSRLISSRDANSNTTFYAYDTQDRHVATTNADGTVRRLIWSPRHNLVRTEDANGTVVSNSFDLLDRCVRRDITPGPGVMATTTFEMFGYDGASRLISASNDVSLVEFEHDSMGNRRACLFQPGLKARMTHDGVGNRLSLEYPSGGVVNFTYDALDQLSSLSRTAGGVTTPLGTFAYEGPGRPGRMTRGNNINTRLTWNGMKNPPNAQGDAGFGQVSGVNHQFAGGGVTVDRRVAAYDPNQNKILREQTLPFAAGVPALTTNVMGYDALNRMTSFDRRRASTIATKSLALDKQGNRQSVSSNGVVELYTMDASTPDPADFQMNQYTITPFGSQTHDRNGNVTSVITVSGGNFYSYDYADRLVLVQQQGPVGLEPVAEFGYDALGRRFRKTVFPRPPALPLTVTYIVGNEECDDRNEVLEEYENGSLLRTYVLPHVFEQKGRISISSSGQISYLLTDEMGTAVALTDEAGEVLERYDYAEHGEPRFFGPDGVPLVDAFGQPATVSPAGNVYLFGGMTWDGETGLYLEPGGEGSYLNPKTGKSLTHVHGDPHVDQKDGTRWDFAPGGNNPWSAGVQEGKKGLNAVNVKLAYAYGGGGGGGGGAGGLLAYKAKQGKTGSAKSARFDDDGDGAGDDLRAQYNPKELTVDKRAPRDAASGLPTGRRTHSPRDAASGQATGKRQHSPRDPASGQATGKRSFSPRDPASGQATGKRTHKDHATGLATGKRTHSPRDAASGQATGKRITSPRDPASGQATGKRIFSPRDPASGQATGKRIFSPRDPASGQATGKRTHKDHATGLATGRRTHSPRDAATGLATGRRTHKPISFGGGGGGGGAYQKTQPQLYKATAGKTGKTK